MIWTSYFGNVKNLVTRYPDIVLISISGKTPEWFIGQKNCIQLKKLAPKYSWWKEWHDTFESNLESEDSKMWYEKKYVDTVLSSVDAKEVEAEMMNASNGKDVCLLCYETPEKFCHRHLVSAWLNRSGIKSEEIISGG